MGPRARRGFLARLVLGMTECGSILTAKAGETLELELGWAVSSMLIDLHHYPMPPARVVVCRVYLTPIEATQPRLVRCAGYTHATLHIPVPTYAGLRRQPRVQRQRATDCEGSPI